MKKMILGLGCSVALAACSAQPPASASSPEDEKAAAEAVMSDLTAPDVPVASYPASLPQVSTWHVHVGSTIAVVGVDAAGRIRAAIALDADEAHPGWCFRGALDADCGAIAAAVAKDLAPDVNAAGIETRSLGLLDSAPRDDATYCSETLSKAAEVYADQFKGAQPRLAVCSLLGTDKLPPGCAQIYTGGAGGPGTTYTYTTKGPSLATACCAANADGASVGSVLIEKRAVPLLCPPTQSASTGGGSTGTTLVE